MIYLKAALVIASFGPTIADSVKHVVDVNLNGQAFNPISINVVANDTLDFRVSTDTQ
jgi:hypothetical protein